MKEFDFFDPWWLENRDNALCKMISASSPSVFGLGSGLETVGGRSCSNFLASVALYLSLYYGSQ